MGRGNETMGKKEVRAKKEKKRQEKEKKRNDRKNLSRDGNSLDDMIAYVDEFGRISSTPPDLSQKTVIKAEEISIAVPKSAPLSEEDLIRHGIVIFFNDSKGFGFIRDLANQKEYFVHVKELKEPVKENSKVMFEIGRGPKGLAAINVKNDKQTAPPSAPPTPAAPAE